MRFGYYRGALTLMVVLTVSCAPVKMEGRRDEGVRGPAGMWVSAYYAGWSQGCSSAARLKPDEIDYDAVTHIFHFAILPKPDGSIDYSKKCISPENSSNLIRVAHRAGRKVLISVGGQNSEQAFLAATDEKNRRFFIENLLVFINSRGYDGIDIDWEPVSESSLVRYRTFIGELRKALDNVSPHPLLTAAVRDQPALLRDLQDDFDQINVMTYCLSGPWPGWKVWHNAALYDAGRRFPNSGLPFPSADGLIEKYIAAGVDRRKLSIGIPFFGYIWEGGVTDTGGVTGPGQGWKTAPSVEEVPYYEIMEKYYGRRYYRWDDDAKAAYLSIDNEGPSGNKFISYDDERSLREKMEYVKARAIGGVFIFELGAGWMPESPRPDMLLQTVKDAAAAAKGRTNQ